LLFFCGVKRLREAVISGNPEEGGLAMVPETLERVLFSRSEWPDSIRGARSELGFSPHFAGAELQYWETNHGYREVLEIALTEVKKQGLPPYFALYWAICFYADWGKGLDRIVWPSSWPTEAEIEVASRIAGAIGLRSTDSTPKAMAVWGFALGERGKVYPPYPFILSIPPLFKVINAHTKEPVSSRTEVVVVSNVREINSRFYCRLCDTKDGLQPSFVVEIPDEFRNKELLELAYRLSFRLKLYAKSLTVWTQAGAKGITADYSIRFWGHVHKASHGVSLKSVSDLRSVVIEHGPRRLGQHVHRGKVRLIQKSPRIGRDLERYAAGEVSFEDLLRKEWFSQEVQSSLNGELKAHNDISIKIMIEQRWHKLVYRRVRRRLERAGYKPPPPTRAWWLEKSDMT